MFNKDRYHQLLTTSWLGHNFIYLPEIDSTNTYAKKLEKVLPGTVILADNQTNGKGQKSKSWQTEGNKNLTFSIIFTPKASDRITLFTLACASAISDVLSSDLHCDDIHLKWPNDVLFKNKKLVGVLTEVIHLGNSIDRLIVGIGINVNQKDFPDELKESATSIKNILDNHQQREDILIKILSRIEFNYQRWMSNSVDLVKEVNEKLIGYGEWVTLEIDGVKDLEKCKFLGMNEKGALQVLKKEFEVNTFSYEQVRVFTN